MHKTLQGRHIDENRSELSPTVFSLDLAGLDLTDAFPIQAARILHLHWTSYFLSPYTIAKLGRIGVPLVWTLHDLWPMTGGCHYPAGCLGYESDCRNCPQLRDDTLGLPAAMLADRTALFADLDLTIVAPSRWMADCARRSAVFRGKRIEVIPNGLNTDVFTPLDRAKARSSCGIPPDVPVIAFGAHALNDRRKGGDVLVRALETAVQSYRRLTKSTATLHLLSFGRDALDIAVDGVVPIPCGPVDTDDDLSQMLACADFLVLPSREDNYPNLVIEAMACGVPVVAFDVGGVGDAVIDGETGRLVSPVADAEVLAATMVDLLQRPDRIKAMGAACRARMHPSHSMTAFGRRMIALYEDLNPDFRAPVPDGIARAFDELYHVDTTAHPLKVRPMNRIGPRLDSTDMLGRLLSILDDQGPLTTK
jgi:glycosyltransferase involved in cell wall biosynthesis